MDVKLPPAQEVVAVCCKEAWTARSKGILNQEELEMCMYEISLDCLSHMMYKATPHMPQVLKEYKGYRPSKDQPKEDNASLRDRVMKKPEVEKYYKLLDMIDGDNKSHIAWMEKMLDAFKEFDDKDKFLLVWDVYRHYPPRMQDLKKWGIKEETSVITKAKDVFGGRVVDADTNI